MTNPNSRHRPDGPHPEAASPLGLSVVVPMYNEAAIVEHSVATILKELRALGVPFELILVDDGSRDATWERIEALAAREREVRGARLSRNFGKERAICAAIDLANGEAVVVMDGDLQHPPELIPEMLGIWRAGSADIVRAVKSDRGRESWLYRRMSHLFYASMAFLSGYDLENASDFMLLDRKVVRSLKRMPEQFPFFRGMVAWIGYRQAEVRFAVPERPGGGSRWSGRRLVAYALSNMLSFSAFPLRVVNYLAAAFFLLAIAIGGISLHRWANGTAVEGFTTVIILLLIIGSGILGGLGIIGEYVAKIHDEVKQRPRYLISEEVGFAERTDA